MTIRVLHTDSSSSIHVTGLIGSRTHERSLNVSGVQVGAGVDASNPFASSAVWAHIAGKLVFTLTQDLQPGSYVAFAASSLQFIWSVRVLTLVKPVKREEPLDSDGALNGVH